MNTNTGGKTALFVISVAAYALIVTGCSGKKSVTPAGVNNMVNFLGLFSD